MKRVLAGIMGIGVTLLVGLETSRAEPPTYKLLRVHTSLLPHPQPAPPHYSHDFHARTVHVVPDEPAQPYAYGWFGVSPRRHWSRHFGIYRNYTQWSAR